MKKSVSLVDLKGLNRNSVYNFIYRERTTSKQQIVQGLNMGLSTVSQNIRLLEEARLIERSGSFNSTGGRKADAIQIVRTARVSIGVGILLHSIYIVAIDLYGEVIDSQAFDLDYSNSDEYYYMLGQHISNFIKHGHWQKPDILGVSIATQGTISANGQAVDYGEIMNNYDMKLSNITKHIQYPCRLEHDSKAAAYLELWNNPETENAVVLLLNRNFGGSLIINKKIVKGSHMHAGAIEHLCISRDGPRCYCGNRGCLETYCSANALEAAAGTKAHDFFDKLRQRTGDASEALGVRGGGVVARVNERSDGELRDGGGGARVNERSDGELRRMEYATIWADYLDKLAYAIRNLSIIIDGSIIISGYLATYFTEDDIKTILYKVNSSPFPITREQIIVSTYGQYAPAVGAALYYVDEFKKSV
ncbi:MAG: ROK family transcriptional regulator [Eubacteriales bacterium]|nr:ROK family transcriptional regulator [Eubacteriales bacterium]